MSTPIYKNVDFFVYSHYNKEKPKLINKEGNNLNLANRVRQRREELGLSQEQLALRMGYSSRTSINKIENGRPCSQKIISRLAEALNVSIPYLMGWEEKIEKDPVATAERQVEILMDEDFVGMFDDFRTLDSSKRKIVIDLVHSLAETKKTEA